MELGTFGAILTYAIDFEGKITRFFTAAAQSSAAGPAAPTFGQLAQEGERRLKVLERTRRECVAEMILEPIAGFRSEDFEVKATAGGSGSDLLKQAAEVEVLAEKYYSIASQKVTVPEVSRVLKKMAKAHADQKAMLSGAGA